jgi:D-alanyl-D-alanine carboxypeptidase
MKSLGLFLIVFYIFSCSQNKKKVAINSSVKIQIDSLVDIQNFNGVIKLMKADKIIYEKCSGYSNFDKKSKLKMTDQFVIGSISKQITAVLVLQFYENHKLKLTDTIVKYLTDLKQGWENQITIHQLLTHTHGVTSLSKGLENEPGTKFNYSQIGYDLLAQITTFIFLRQKALGFKL